MKTFPKSCRWRSTWRNGLRGAREGNLPDTIPAPIPLRRRRFLPVRHLPGRWPIPLPECCPPPIARPPAPPPPPAREQTWREPAAELHVALIADGRPRVVRVRKI